MSADAFFANKAGEFKTGQGINAQPKTINHMVGPWIKAMENVLCRAAKPFVIFGYGYPASKLAEHARKCYRPGMFGTVNTDLSSQDTSKTKVFNKFRTDLYRKLGIPAKVISIMHALSDNWQMHHNDFRFRVKGSLHSGEARTPRDRDWETC